jgi:hypothetical protein
VSRDHHGHDHDPTDSFGRNLRSGDYNPLSRGWILVTNLIRRLRPPHDCCGHYGEPGC